MNASLLYCATLKRKHSLPQIVCDLSSVFRPERISLATKGSEIHISIETQTGHMLLRNSFLPDVKITISEQTSDAYIGFAIKPCICVLGILFYLALAIFEIVLLFFLLTNELSTPMLLLIPPGMAIYSLLLCRLGLWRSSVHLLQQITEILSGKESIRPKLLLVKDKGRFA